MPMATKFKKYMRLEDFDALKKGDKTLIIEKDAQGNILNQFKGRFKSYDGTWMTLERHNPIHFCSTPEIYKLVEIKKDKPEAAPTQLMQFLKHHEYLTSSI